MCTTAHASAEPSRRKGWRGSQHCMTLTCTHAVATAGRATASNPCLACDDIMAARSEYDGPALHPTLCCRTRRLAIKPLASSWRGSLGCWEAAWRIQRLLCVLGRYRAPVCCCTASGSSSLLAPVLASSPGWQVQTWLPLTSTCGGLCGGSWRAVLQPHSDPAVPVPCAAS